MTIERETLIVLVYLVFSGLRLLTSLSLSMLNIGNIFRHQDEPPEAVKERITPEEYRKSQRYSIRKEHFAIVETLFSTLFVLLLIFTGILGSLDQWLSGFITRPFWLGFCYLILISIISNLFQFPFSFYRQFVLEEEFGFNRMTLKLYFTDQIKEALVSLLISLPLLALLYWFLEQTGELWWLFGWGIFVLFQLLLFFIYPVVIAPLFNKFTPLEEGEMKEGLTKLAAKAGFAHQGIFLMDGSKRSAHSNAYFTGFGRFRRIVLFDTLTEQLSQEELEGVLAHEIGHFKKKHILKRMIGSILMIGAGFFLLDFFMHWMPLYQAFRFSSESIHSLLVILMFLSSPFSFFLTPLGSRRSRKQEFQADRYSKELMGRAEPLIGALMKLNTKNLSNLTPHPLYSGFYYSHPTVLERRAAILKDDASEKQVP